MLSAKRKFLLNLKNIPGWTTKRKIVVFSVDDYGNIHVASKEAHKSLKKEGLKVDSNRFVQYDALENAQDLEQLFETLSSVKDKHRSHAVFTAFAMPANINFEAIAESDYTTYQYEILPKTFKRLPGYEGVWKLWEEGMKNKLIFPQFHGREHVNIKMLMALLKNRDAKVMACFNNRSYCAIPDREDTFSSYVSAFKFDHFEENEFFKTIIADGLNVFEKVFGFRASHFNAPGWREHHILEKSLKDGGIEYIDTDSIKNEHQGDGKYKKIFHYSGQSNSFGQVYLVRNCIFEPSIENQDWVDTCLAEIEIAFKWNKPANISSHRVNFCGHIEPEVRAHGLKELKRLLTAIVKKWPDVEFLTTVELGALIRSATNKEN
jgi:hypothetical protein